MANETRIRVPRPGKVGLVNWLILGGTVVVAVGILVWGVVSPVPANRFSAIAAFVILVVLFAVLIGRSTWIDPDRGLVVGKVLWFWRKPVELSTAHIALVNNRGGTLMLGIRGAGRRTSIYLPLLQIGDYGNRSQEPEFLRFLADVLDRWAPKVQRTVTEPLRKQAEFIASGGAPQESPLAPMLTNSAMKAAKGGGAAGTGGSLL